MFFNFYKPLFCALLFLCTLDLRAQSIQRCDPPYWFKEMGCDTLQLLLYGDGIDKAEIQVKGGPKILKSVAGIGKGYRLIYVKINSRKQGDFSINCNVNQQVSRYLFSMREKPRSSAAIAASDRMYLLMPDRFANANPGNDDVKTMLEKANRNDLHGRHGGDLAGIQQRLDYITDMGFNALWMTPVLENNQPSQSYHGYACTDHYRVDPRYGSMEEYIDLANKCRSKGIKFVLDVVYNHVGNEHALFKQLISKDWFHFRDTFFRTNYRVSSLSDPYAAASEKSTMLHGWFDKHMPDVNQDNVHVQRYLIQNSLWWIAVTQASALRVDTYPYSQPGFLRRLNIEVKRAFPHLFIFGETWEHTLAAQAYFAPSVFHPKSKLIFAGLPHAVTDFQFCFGLHQALNEPFGWNTGLSRLYYLFASDLVYRNPRLLVTFADNHDLNRMHAVFGQDISKTKMALSLMYMGRGIPCVFYGTEILMKDTGAHGAIRRDFPGGWSGDEKNGFSPDGRTAEQQGMHDYIRRLSQIRQQYASLFTEGKRTQYIPVDGVYAFFLEGEDDVIGVFVNQSSTPKAIIASRYSDIKADWAKGSNDLTANTTGFYTSGISPMSTTIIHFPRKP